MSGYDHWRTTTAEDLSHLEECPCSKCHARHIELGLILEYRNKVDFPCCEEEFEDMVAKGQICHLHPEAYFEPATKDKPSFCEKCDLGVRP